IHACGLKAVAEGIETAEQAEELVGLGCASGQGYYFGRPTPPEAVEALISLGRTVSR
ncbi:MAG: EAL domain-containing protein, partial [Arthrobacter sp.]|nr:EAL domain-containing protein [Arthrobacter sp.]